MIFPWNTVWKMLPSKNTSFCSFSPKMFREPELLKGILHSGLISGSGISPEEGDGNPLQYSCLENPMERGGWQATVHGVVKSQTQLK